MTGFLNDTNTGSYRSVSVFEIKDVQVLSNMYLAGWQYNISNHWNNRVCKSCA